MNDNWTVLFMRFLEDDPFTVIEECYLDSKTGEVIFLHDSIGHEEFLKKSRAVSSEPERYIEIPATSHDEWHDLFREWYEKTTGEGWSFPSIGGTLNQMT
jgi:hypothetical protein